MVLNEKQRQAKRKLIEENRQKRRHDSVSGTSPVGEGHVHCSHSDALTSEDHVLIQEVVVAYEQTANKGNEANEVSRRGAKVGKIIC